MSEEAIEPMKLSKDAIVEALTAHVGQRRDLRHEYPRDLTTTNEGA